jgi:hypothetical protein
MSISFLPIICIIFNEAFTYNVFDTTYKRVTCSSTLSGHPSSSRYISPSFPSSTEAGQPTMAHALLQPTAVLVGEADCAPDAFAARCLLSEAPGQRGKMENFHGKI